MQEVKVTQSIDAPSEAIERALSPAALIEYAGTYEVREVDDDDGEVVVTAGTADLKSVLVFTETDSGYVYRQRDDHGPFEAMYSSVSVSGENPTVLTARSCYTFGLPFARLTDWFARRERQTELRRMLAGIEAAVQRAADGGGVNR